jgi:hypothetical protein
MSDQNDDLNEVPEQKADAPTYDGDVGPKQENVPVTDNSGTISDAARQIARSELAGGTQEDVAQVMAQVAPHRAPPPQVQNPAFAPAPIRSQAPGVQPVRRPPPRPPVTPPPETHPFGNHYLTGGEAERAAAIGQSPVYSAEERLAWAIDTLAGRVVQSVVDPSALSEGDRRTIDRDVQKLDALISYAKLKVSEV